MLTAEQPGGIVTPPVVVVPPAAGVEPPDVVAVAAVVPLVAVAAVVPFVAVAAVVPVVAVATVPVVAVDTAPVVGVAASPHAARLVPMMPISTIVLSHFFVLDAIVVSSLVTFSLKETMACIPCLFHSSLVCVIYFAGVSHLLSCAPAAIKLGALFLPDGVVRICSIRRVIS
jgi:hypothetical protein